MQQGDDLLATPYVVTKALLAIGMWGAGAIGFLLTPLNTLERLIAIASASLLVVAWPMTDEAGMAAIAAFIAWHVWRSRRAGTTRAA